MRSLIEILQLSTKHLEKSGMEHARRQAEELIADTLHLTRMQLYLEYDRPLLESELVSIRENLVRRAKGEPNPYIQGYVEFFGSKIKVTPDVLIPRQETEILVDLIVKELSRQDLKDKTFLDLCCGSGSIGIVLKKRFPELKVILSDFCPKALAIAKENSEGLDIEILEGDLLQPFKGRKTHFLVCNPPYISENEFKELDPEVKNFEPKLALLAGPSGLEFYERLARELPAFLYENAKIWFEMGHAQGPALSLLFPKGQVLKDWSGKDRFLTIFP